MYIDKPNNFLSATFQLIKKRKIPAKLQNINFISSAASTFFINIFVQKVSIYIVLQLKISYKENGNFQFVLQG